MFRFRPHKHTLLVGVVVQGDGKELMSVRHFQFLAWPRDSVLPVNNSALLTLFQMLEKWQQRSGNTAIVIHCM